MANSSMRSSPEFCNHYVGLYYSKVCKAGVTYADIERPKEPSDTSRLNRLPCFEEPSSLAVPCPHRQFPTKEEREERERRIAQHLEEFARKLESDICPECDCPMTKKQVGPCVYASPCGHRLYQGRAS